MSQDAIKYERLVALAGWLWMRLRDNRPLFRRSDLLEVDRLSYLGGPEAKARKAFERAQKDLSTFGVVVEWDEFATVDNDYDNTGAFRIRGLKLTPEQQQALMGLAFSIAYRDLESGHAVKIPGAFLDGAGETLLLDANRFVAPVAEAIDDHACISFLYREATMPREAQPIRLVFERVVSGISLPSTSRVPRLAPSGLTTSDPSIALTPRGTTSTTRPRHERWWPGPETGSSGAEGSIAAWCLPLTPTPNLPLSASWPASRRQIPFPMVALS